MRTPGLKPPSSPSIEGAGERVSTPAPEAIPTGPPATTEATAEVEQLRTKNAAAPSRTTPDIPSSGDAAVKFFTARKSYGTYLLSHALRNELASAFGPEGVPFFELYYQLEAIARDPAAPRPRFHDLKRQFDEALAAFGRTTHPVSARILDKIWEARRSQDSNFDAILRSVCLKAGPSADEWRTLNDFFQRAIGSLARDQGVYLTLGRNGTDAWPSLRLLSAREKELKRLSRDDLPAFQLIHERRAFYQERDAAVRDAIARIEQEEGVDVASRKALVRGRVVTIADVLDDAGQTARTLILDVDAVPRSYEEFLSWRQALLSAKEELVKSEGDDRASRVLSDAQLASMRVVDDRALAELPGPVEMRGLADDASTRTLATKPYGKDRIVTEGRYAGIPVQSLVDNAGHLLESAVDQPGRQEPFLWYDERKQRLVLDFPNKQGDWTPMRQALRRLARQEEDIEYERIDYQPRFTFPPSLYEEIEQIIVSPRRTARATEVLESHFAEQARLETATRLEEAARFTTEAIGGFKEGVEFRPDQKGSLAYLEAKDGRGVINLDTGDGKTLVAIAEMLLAIRNGRLDDPNTNGRFLFVCDRDTAANLPDQIKQFCDKKTQKLLLSALHRGRRGRIDVMTYGQFERATRSGTWKRKPWSADEYISGFFDEAHKKLVRRSATSEAISKMKAPKVLLTASLVDKNPAQALTLRYLADGVDLYSEEAAPKRREIAKVSRNLSVRVGPYEVGINPLRRTRAKMIFQGVFHKKRAPLPADLVPATERLTMNADVQRAYEQQLASVPGLRPALQASVAVWRDLGKSDDPKVDPRDPRIAGLNAIDSELKHGFDLLYALENRPNRVGDLDGKLVDLDELDAATAAGVKPLMDYNPNLRRTAQRFADKLERSPRSRAGLMIDNKGMVEEAALEMIRADVPGGHAACLPDRIVVYRQATPRAIEKAQEEKQRYARSSGSPVEVELVQVDDQPLVKTTFRPGQYRDSPEGSSYSSRDWHQYVLRQLQEKMHEAATDIAIRTLSMYRPTYGHGHNLQKGGINTVIDVTTPKGYQAGHQSLSRFWRQGITVDSVEHVSVRVGLGADNETLGRYDLLPGEIQRERNQRERSIYEDSVAVLETEGHYGGLPPDTRTSLIQNRRLFQLEQEIAQGDRIL